MGNSEKKTLKLVLNSQVYSVDGYGESACLVKQSSQQVIINLVRIQFDLKTSTYCLHKV